MPEQSAAPPASDADAALPPDAQWWQGRRVVVTGADGFLGSNLCRLLVASGARVRAGVGPTRRHALMREIGVEPVDVDVRDAGQVLRLVDTGEPTVVFHCAGLITLDTHATRELWRTNVIGTRHVLAACRAARVERLVHVSTIHALPEEADGTTREPGRLRPEMFQPALVVGGYAQSKAAATRSVVEADDLHRVVLFPTGFGGPLDPGPGPVNHLVLKLASGSMPVIVAGGNDFADMRDVAAAVQRAGEAGRNGHGYVLNRGWVSIDELATMVVDLVGRRRPPVLPLPLAHAVVPFTGAVARVRGVPASLTRYSLHTLRHPTITTHEDAARDLGYRPRPLAETIRSVVEEAMGGH